jgi:hypothetical protein
MVGLMLVFSLVVECSAKGATNVEKMKLQQDRILAKMAVENLMGRLVYYRAANMNQKCTELFANGDPDLKIQVPPGIYEGPDAAIRVYGDPEAKQKAASPGELHFHTLVSPVIEVAGDARTARALWMSPGAVSRVRGGTASASWAWTKYAADFKKVNGEWKIWHQRIITVFNTAYDTPWTETKAAPQMAALKAQPGTAESGKPVGGAPKGGGMPQADRPNPDNYSYTTTGQQQLVPEPPTPYDTWDDTMSCVQ